MAANRNSPEKHVWRAQIVLLSAAGVGTNEIMRQTGKSKTCVWRWQERFMAEGFDGLLHDKTRPSRVAATSLFFLGRCHAEFLYSFFVTGGCDLSFAAFNNAKKPVSS